MIDLSGVAACPDCGILFDKYLCGVLVEGRYERLKCPNCGNKFNVLDEHGAD